MAEGIGSDEHRRSERVPLSALVRLRKRGAPSYQVRIFDLSPHGCRLEFIERPMLEQQVTVKFEGLEGLEATVCWFDSFSAGVEFRKPLHPAVFDMLVQRRD